MKTDRGTMRLYRMGNWLHRHRVPLAPRALQGLGLVLFSSVVPATAQIGRGTVLAYAGLGIVIHARARIGEGCLIAPQVTIGGRSGHAQVPVIGDRVFIGAGARILGPVTVGDGAVIGANAVVVADVEPRTLVAGVPARVIRRGVAVDEFATMPSSK